MGDAGGGITRDLDFAGASRSAVSPAPLRWGAVLRLLTAGESHGKALVVTVEGLPAGLEVKAEDIAAELARRRLGYGRGPR
ncbi:MAG: chorismate synthase, partial [Acidimicrobiales bacterium]